MSYLIVLTIGPVQAYISQARRTHDLWQGSRILSYLAGAGVETAKGDHQATVIYPHVEAAQSDNIPNRIVIQWEGDESSARTCASNMKDAIEKRWDDVAQNTYNTFSNGKLADKVKGIWDRQVGSWLECYWIIAPYDKANHGGSMRGANALMGSRKLLRNFPQIQEEGRKCSITGEHEALHDGRKYEDFWNDLRGKHPNLAMLGKHERLSAISTIKRFAHESRAGNTALAINYRYPSTSSIAAAKFKFDLLQRIASKTDGAVLPALQDFIQSLLDCVNVYYQDEAKSARELFFSIEDQFNPEYFPKMAQVCPSAFEKRRISANRDDWDVQLMSLDGNFFFEDTLITKTIAEYLPPMKDTEIKNLGLEKWVTKALEALQRLLKVSGLRPEPYLVILSMDGDSMGRTLSHLGSREQHQTFSRLLADYARQDVPRIVEQAHLGRVVYAGGDDVLALLPVHEALQVADELRRVFAERVAAEGIRNHNGEVVTASTGLAYVHHTHNLQEAVHTAHEAETFAKDQLDRNAIVVKFLRRSGEPRQMGGKWTIGGESLIGQIEKLIQAFSQGLSRNLPYDLAQIAYSMKKNVPDEAVKEELKRVIKRRLDIKDKEEKERKALNIRDTLWMLKADDGWEDLQHWVELARFIAQRTEGDAE